jgi:hypothetical protein
MVCYLSNKSLIPTLPNQTLTSSSESNNRCKHLKSWSIGRKVPGEQLASAIIALKFVSIELNASEISFLE